MAFALWIILYFLGSLLFLALLCWLVVTAYIFRVHRRYAHIPSPKMSSFYLGHAPAMLAKTEKDGCNGELILKWSVECRNSPLIAIFMVHHPMLVTLNPEDIKLLLQTSSKAEKSKFLYKELAYPFGERFLGGGLATELNHDRWKVRRRLYDPTFTKGSIKDLLPLFVECADSFVERLRHKADGKTKVVMFEEFTSCAHELIGKVLCNATDAKQSNGQLGEKNAKENGNLLFMFQHASEGQTKSSSWLPFYKYLHPFEAEVHREAIRAGRKVARKLIQSRIKAVMNGEKIPNDILTQILRRTNLEESVDVEDLIDDFATFYVAGYETASNTSCFALALLLQHPDIMQRVLDELNDVLEHNNYSLTSKDVDKMKYLEQVCFETLRIYPPVAQILRDTIVDTTLSGYEVPKGTTISINFDANHHNPEYWENPDKFDPDRFDPGRPSVSPFTYHPFSVGIHSCIGKMFGLMQFKVVMARLLTNFKFKLPDGYEIKPISNLTLKPDDGVPCMITPLQ